MDHYINLHVLPVPELPAAHVLGMAFTRFHDALVSLRCSGIGVSFPGIDEKKTSLGQHLRLHGQEAVLAELMNRRWLKGMTDYLRVSGLLAVPSQTKHRRVFRVQAKSSPERLRRRHMRRHGLSEAEAAERISAGAAERLTDPYIIMNSQSSGQRFRLFIRHGPLLTAPEFGDFNAYGLSLKATVPWF